VRLEHRVITARLCAPMVSAHGAVDVRRLVLVSLYDHHSGLTGYGEAAPLAAYDGVEVDDVLAALNDSREVLSGLDPGLPREEALTSCTQATVLPQAVAAIDLALWDLAGRRAREPVWRLLGAPAAEGVTVNATIGAADRAGAASAAAAARAAGFTCVKVKVGIGDDAGRLAAVRAAAGPAMAIRVDANGAWSVPEALAALIAGFPAAIAGLNRTSLGPLRADISGAELRRAALRAFAEVLSRLEIDAPQVIFGHTHRAGPLPPDPPAEWTAATGSQHITFRPKGEFLPADGDGYLTLPRDRYVHPLLRLRVNV